MLMGVDGGKFRMSERTSGAEGRPRNVVWRLYTEYADDGRRYAALGTVATLVGRAVGLVPALVIGLAVDAVFLAQRPYQNQGESPVL